MGPAGLHHPDLRIGEVMDGAHQKIFRRSEVGVENGNEFALRRLHPLRQRARFEALAIRAVMVGDGIAQRRIALHQTASHVDGLVGRVVQHLNVELFPRIFQLADRLQQPLHNILLVEDRQLHGDPRQVFKIRRRLGRAFFPVLVIQIHQHVAMHPICRPAGSTR